MIRTYPETNRREGGTFLQTAARSEDAGVADRRVLRQGQATQPQEAKMSSLPMSGFGIGSITAIIPAAGLGLRLKCSVPKPLVKIGRKPILAHTLSALAVSSFIKNFLVAVPKDSISEYRNVLDRYRIKKRVDFVVGGLTRRDSVRNCLKELPVETNIVLVHDAVRPFVSKELLSELLRAAGQDQAVVCGVSVKATIKKIKNQKSKIKNELIVEETLERSNLWEIQTPQVFRKDLILEAYERYGNGSVTDDASLVEKMGVKIRVVLGSYFNIKITTREDLVFAEAILRSQKSKGKSQNFNSKLRICQPQAASRKLKKA